MKNHIPQPTKMYKESGSSEYIVPEYDLRAKKLADGSFEIYGEDEGIKIRYCLPESLVEVTHPLDCITDPIAQATVAAAILEGELIQWKNK